MVSTRQMSTTLSPPQGSNEDNQMLAGSARLVTTRQSSSNNLLNTALVTSVRNRSIQGDELNFEKDQQQKIFLLDLPIENLHNIFSYVGYKKIGQMRVVSN